MLLVVRRSPSPSSFLRKHLILSIAPLLLPSLSDTKPDSFATLRVGLPGVQIWGSLFLTSPFSCAQPRYLSQSNGVSCPLTSEDTLEGQRMQSWRADKKGRQRDSSVYSLIIWGFTNGRLATTLTPSVLPLFLEWGNP